jgi:shikimate kinase
VQLAARLSTPEQLAMRPLLERDPALLEQRLTTLLRAREQAYRRASVVVDADATPDEVAVRVERALQGTSEVA